MFLIVLGHSWGEGVFGPWRGESAEVNWWVFLMIGMLIWHVDGFISISGWFGIRFSWKKFFYLLGTIAFYSVVSAVIELSFGHPVGLTVLEMRSGWFGGGYLALMLAAPLINASVDDLVARSRRQLFSAWLLLAVAFFFTWAPEHLFTGINAPGFGHQTFTMMAFVYLTARVARNLFDEPVQLKSLLRIVGMYVLFLLGGAVAIGSGGNWEHSIIWKIWSRGTLNSSPFMYLMAMVFLMLFVWHVRIPEWLGRIVVFLSPSMFGVYLFHCQFVVPLEVWLKSHLGGHPFVLMLLTSLGLFGFCVTVDLFRRLIVSLGRVPSDRALNWLDKQWTNFASRGSC